MEMHQIRYFLAVCDKRNFTQAAQSTFVSQPSLTQAIKKLEDELGGELFIRDRSGCVLTSLGCMVEPKLRHIYQDALNTKAEAIRFSHLKKTPLRVGLMSTIGAQRLSPFFARYQHEYPNTELELIVESETVLLKHLHSGILDLIISTPEKLPGKPCHSVLLYEERYVVVYKPSHRFAKMKKIGLEEIQSEPFLDRLNCELRDALKSICSDREIDLYAAYRSNSEEWILHMVRAGIGFALMPEYSLPSNAKDISFQYLTDPEISRRVYAVHSGHVHHKSELSTMVKRLELGI